MSTRRFIKQWSARAMQRIRSGAAPTEATWAIETLPADARATRARVRALSKQPGYRVVDTLQDQLVDLVSIAHPGRRLEGAALEAALDEARMGKSLADYGNYVHYPWKRELVRVLPREAFVQVRTSRNQYKITVAEQRALGTKRVAVAGLSVGLAVLTTLALERVGGAFHLADFDELSLTNMNRLMAGVAEIGLPKTTLAARRLLELDPYLELRLFPKGVQPDNVAEFLRGVDLLIEECDDLAAKLYLREQAKERRLPVLMQTSEGGLLDVERFDLEPERPPFHGLVGELEASQLPAMGRRDKVPLVARIVQDGLSARGAASMLEIETTLATWPQLGSAVVAGAGAVVDVARRVLLGDFESSGRFVFDPATALVPGLQRYERPLENHVVEPASREESPDPGSVLSAGVGSLDRSRIEALVALASRAPSGGNVQPWAFEWNEPTLRLRLDSSRGGGALNFDDLANALALGAAAESVVLGATLLGYDVAPVAEGTQEGRRYERTSFSFTTRCSASDPLASRLASRASNRQHAASAPITAAERAAVQGSLSAERTVWLTTDRELTKLAAVLAEGDRVRILHPTLHADMMGELRLPEAPADTLDDGIETSTMDLDGAELAVLRLWARPEVAATLRKLELGRGIYELARKRAKHASAAVVLRTDARTFDAFFTAGRDLLRLWLRAEAAGLAVHPWGALGFLVQHEENDAERARRQDMALGALKTDYRALVPRHAGGEALLLFLHRAPASAVVSRRRGIGQVMGMSREESS